MYKKQAMWSRDFKFFMQKNSLVHYFRIQGNFRLCNGIEVKLFFVNYVKSGF